MAKSDSSDPVIKVDFSAQNREASVVADNSEAAVPSDHAAYFSALYRDHWYILRNRLYKLFGSGPPDPEDLIQEAFTKLAELDSPSDIRFPRAFLLRIAINLGLNHKKRIKTAQKFIDNALAEVDEPILEQGGPEDVYTMSQRVELTQRAFDKLSPKQKEIIERSRLKGETYAEISSHTGWSKADISRQLNEALALLQQAIDEE